MHARVKYGVVGTVSAVLILNIACGGGSSSPTSPGAPASPQLGAPVPDSPRDDVQLGTLRPTLTVRNGTSNQPGARTYEFSVSDRSDFSAAAGGGAGSFQIVVSASGVPEGAGGTTSFTPDQDLQPTTRMYWRARVRQATAVSEWSQVAVFRTKLMGFNRSGELYDPLIHGETIGAITGSTTFVQDRGLRINDANSWVRYRLARTLTSGEFSAEVEGLYPDHPESKGKIFSMMDGGNNLYTSKFIANVQYRGQSGNPPNCIAFKAVFGDEDFKVEPDRARRTASVMRLDPARTYLWRATWGDEFRLVVLDGGVGGARIYDYGIENGGTYNPSPHYAYLGANNGPFGQESGSRSGVIYRNVWIGSRPRPDSLGSALMPLR